MPEVRRRHVQDSLSAAAAALLCTTLRQGSSPTVVARRYRVRPQDRRSRSEARWKPQAQRPRFTEQERNRFATLRNPM